ncbi:putative Ig domain protein [compost metagenome]
MKIRNRILNALLAGAMIASSVGPSQAAMFGSHGEYFFRYKDPVFKSASDNGLESKDVTVFYVAGVGFPFDEILPLKPEWQDDDWRIVSGSLPDGISFNAATRSFSGTPTLEAAGQVVKLEGFDLNGNSVAKASVTFDVVTLQGVPVPTTLYAHTGHYKVDELPVPDGMPSGVAIESWAKLYALPGGVDLDNRYVQGTPTKPGTYKLLITGENYKGDVVATYFGKYVIEDGPTFPHIRDVVDKLPQLEWGWGLQRDFGAPSPYGVNYKIDPMKGVRYYVERKTPTEVFPGTTASNEQPLNLNIRGWVYEPYQTATIRFKAVDVDGTVGYSNWFAFGSSDPQPGCNPFSSSALPVVTGVETNIQIPPPFGAQGSVTYNLTEGKLPGGLSLDAKSGIISGQALVAGDNQNISIVVDVANGEHVVSTQECKYQVVVKNGAVGIGDLTGSQARHVRAGTYYDGVIGITGGIPDYDLSFTDPSALPYLSFLSSTHNAATVDIGGVTVDAGRKSVDLTLANGDGTSKKGFVSFEVHAPLSIGPVRDFHVKRLEASKTVGRVPFDPATVVPDTAGGETPKFTFTNTQAMPIGVGFDDNGWLSGATSEPAGTYGPFMATMSDFTGESVTSAEFNVIVDEREPIAASLNAPQKFNVEWDKTQTLDSFTVQQPAGAKDLQKSWTLATKDGSAVPAWLSINAANGRLSAAAGIPYAQKGEYGPFVATVTDTDGSSGSVEFSVTLQDWPDPAPLAAVVVVNGTVSGTGTGETTTVVPVPDLRAQINESTVIGGLQGVSFISSDPAAPGGLTLDTSAGKLAGTATESYDGPVSVTFADARGRRGTLAISLKVKPYPAADVQENYDLPRLALAENLASPILPQKNDGFWSAPTWSVDATKGADISQYGLSVDPIIGMIKGSTDAVEGTVIQGIVLAATSLGANGETLRNWTEPFSITVGPAAPIEVAYDPAAARYFLEEGTLAYKGKDAVTPKLMGSFKAPLAWSLDGASSSKLAAVGLSINSANGEIVGQPTQLGHWDAFVTATDAEGRTNAVPAALKIVSTLSGNIALSSNGSHPEWTGWPQAWTTGKTKILRVGEPFYTPEVAVSNAVPPVSFVTTPSPVESGLMFRPDVGSYQLGSHFETQGNRSVLIDALDADGRTLGSQKIQITFDVKAPLYVSVPEAVRSIAARQYSAEEGDPVNVSLAPSITNRIGDITFDLDGQVPGILVRVIYDNGVPHYEWDSRKSSNPADLPRDAIVFDTRTATLKGVPSQAGSFSFTLVATDDHKNAYAQDSSDRIANNTARSASITITVAPASALVLKSSENPKGIVVPSGNGLMSVTPVYAAYGAASTFTVSGTLPPGITYKTDATGAYFSGKFTGTLAQLGTYSGITVSATDFLGRTASLPVSFRVFLSSEPIGLTLADLKTKAGYPASLQPVADNYFGALRFYSYDLTDSLGSQLSLNSGSGLLSGTFTSVADYTVNVYVTDATSRVTSKPLKISVIPNLKVTVPQQVLATQGDAVNRTVLTDYKLGTVAYEKANPSAWPDGFDVDPSTGAITSQNVAAAAGTYSGLQIKATDTFQSGGAAQTDTQVSNTFAIVISVINANPIISDLGKTILGKVGTQATALVPTVVDDVKGRPWNYNGTVYSASHDLSQYGLFFDPTSGRISGTPTTAFVIKDFVITVTSASGASDSTQPFWIGVAPEAALALAAGQTGPINIRRDDTVINSPAPVFSNAVGTLTFTMSASIPNYYSINAAGSVVPVGSISTLPLGWYQAYTTVTDEFGRQLAFTRDMYVRDPLIIQPVANPVKVTIGGTLSNLKITSVTALWGNTTAVHAGDGKGIYSVQGLPSGWTFDASTGTVSGPVSGNDGDTVNLTVSVTDPGDGLTKSTVVPILLVKVDGYIYYRMIDRTAVGYAINSTYILGGFGITTFYDTNGTSLNSLLVANPAPPQTGGPYTNVYSVSKVYDWLHVQRDAEGFWKAYRFSQPVAVKRIVADTYAQWNATYTQFVNAEIEASNDGVNWVSLNWKPGWPLNQTHLDTTKP